MHTDRQTDIMKIFILAIDKKVQNIFNDCEIGYTIISVMMLM